MDSSTSITLKYFDVSKARVSFDIAPDLGIIEFAGGDFYKLLEDSGCDSSSLIELKYFSSIRNASIKSRNYLSDYFKNLEVAKAVKNMFNLNTLYERYIIEDHLDPYYLNFYSFVRKHSDVATFLSFVFDAFKKFESYYFELIKASSDTSSIFDNILKKESLFSLNAKAYSDICDTLHRSYLSVANVEENPTSLYDDDYLNFIQEFKSLGDFDPQNEDFLCNFILLLAKAKTSNLFNYNFMLRGFYSQYNKKKSFNQFKFSFSLDKFNWSYKDNVTDSFIFLNFNKKDFAAIINAFFNDDSQFNEFAELLPYFNSIVSFVDDLEEFTCFKGKGCHQKTSHYFRCFKLSAFETSHNLNDIELKNTAFYHCCKALLKSSEGLEVFHFIHNELKKFYNKHSSIIKEADNQIQNFNISKDMISFKDLIFLKDDNLQDFIKSCQIHLSSFDDNIPKFCESHFDNLSTYKKILEKINDLPELDLSDPSEQSILALLRFLIEFRDFLFND